MSARSAAAALADGVPAQLACRLHGDSAMEIEHEPALVEQSVSLALRGRAEARLFERQRENAERIRDADSRAAALEALHLAWFERLGFAAPLSAALAEQPLVRAVVAHCAVGRRLRRADAESRVLERAPRAGESAAACRLLRIRVAPAALLDTTRYLVFLRRQLQYAADVLDPRFAYDPTFPRPGTPWHDVLRARYRVVWATTVDGRLVRAGRLAPEARRARRDEFVRTFSALGPQARVQFTRFFDDPTPTHAAIAAFVTGTWEGYDALAAARRRPAPLAVR